MIKKFSVVWLLLFAAVALKAQVEFTASAPKVVRVGEQFRLSFAVNERGKDFHWPSLDGFSVLSGPNVSSSSSVQIINGQMTQEQSFTYTYILMAQQEGTFTIPSATIKVGRKDYSTPARQIEVVQGQQQAQAGGNNQQNQGSQQSTGTVNGTDLYVSVDVDKRNLYQGEHLTATIKVYTKVSLAGFEDIKFPAYTGFWSQDIETPQQIQLTRENVNGEIYEVGVFKKTLLFPQRSGELTIEPFDITMLVRQQVRSNNPFDDFFGGSYRTVKKNVKSKPITINVKPLPANKPADFNGAVGDMDMVAAIDKTDIAANEAVNLRIRISGNGNMKLIKPLKVDFPPDLDVYDPKTTLKTDAGTNGVTGSVSFNYLIIPRFAGTYRIPPVKFTYFDTKTKTYQTHTSDEFEINVTRGENSEAQSSGVVQGVSKEDVRFLGQDIRFIKTNYELYKKKDFLFGSKEYYLIIFGSLALFIVILAIQRNRIKQNANQAKMKNRKAGKVSQKRLKKAALHMKNNEDALFYEEILKAMWGFLSDKLSIPVSNLSKDNVEGILKSHSVDTEAINELMELLNSCEFARYAPSAVSGGTADIYKKAGNIISNLNQKIK